MAKKNLKGKFVIAFDTLADGWQCATNEKGKPDPTLHNSEAEAMIELFDDALSMLENQTDADRKENGISKKKYAEMKEVFKTGNAEAMTKFLEANPSCNYNGEFIVPAEEFKFGRKTIFTGKGLTITGTNL